MSINLINNFFLYQYASIRRDYQQLSAKSVRLSVQNTVLEKCYPHLAAL